MINYKKIYCEFFGYDIEDYVPCEICSKRAVDVHHIENKGMGSSGLLDFIENLMALCRTCHTAYGDKVQFLDWLKQLHLDFMKIKDI